MTHKTSTGPHKTSTGPVLVLWALCAVAGGAVTRGTPTRTQPGCASHVMRQQQQQQQQQQEQEQEQQQDRTWVTGTP